jgi:hypothetical protein
MVMGRVEDGAVEGRPGDSKAAGFFGNRDVSSFEQCLDESAMQTPNEHVGIPLEDMLLIAETGYENLSGFVPIEIAGSVSF